MREKIRKVLGNLQQAEWIMGNGDDSDEKIEQRLEAHVDKVMKVIKEEIKEMLDDIDYSSERVGCGLEDNSIADNRYSGGEYGYNLALDDVRRDLEDILESE